jgi:DNA-directed RNA polymerase specialized sigma24 family protein
MPGSPTVDACDFEALYATFFPRIVRYLTRLVGPDGAEDLAQEVFIKISRSLGAGKRMPRCPT